MQISPTIVLVALNVIATIYAWNSPDILSKWMLNPYKINRDNQYYRFITSGFIHADWIHLIFNMIALYSFGSNLEYYLMAFTGADYQFYYYGIYVVALIVSDIPSFIKHKNDISYNALGASGAVSAVVFACIMVSPVSWLTFFFIPMPAFIFGIAYLFYSYYLSSKNAGGINHDAHFYGAVVGILSIIAIYPRVLPAFFQQISNWSIF